MPVPEAFIAIQTSGSAAPLIATAAKTCCNEQAIYAKDTGVRQSSPTLTLFGSMQRDTLISCLTGDLPWAPWAMPGAQFKLLHADPDTERFSLLIKLDAGVVAPLHRHVGAVEGYVLSGSFYYADAPQTVYAVGSYLLERDGAVHQPVSPDGAVMFAVFHGPVEGLDATGELTGRVDWRWHVKAWKRYTGQASKQT